MNEEDALWVRWFDCIQTWLINSKSLYTKFLSLNAHKTLPPCPHCTSTFTCEDGALYICPECAHEWSSNIEAHFGSEVQRVYRDAAGNILNDRDAATVVKDLKLKGSAGVVKMGAKVKNIRLVDRDHAIDCKIDGFGALSLKSEFIKKV